jgi:hypothetical protein
MLAIVPSTSTRRLGMLASITLKPTVWANFSIAAKSSTDAP